MTCGKYTYTITASDLKMEQEAFEAGEGVSQSTKLVIDSFVTLRDLKDLTDLLKLHRNLSV